jgi:hypothetical protein
MDQAKARRERRHWLLSSLALPSAPASLRD